MTFFKRYLSSDDRKTLAAEIAQAERTCSGEIRVVFRHHRHWNERKLSVHELAVREFHLLGMEKTVQRTGVLIFLMLSDRKFQIIADSGIHAKVEEGTWDEIAQALSGHFREGKYLGGLRKAVVSVGAVLTQHFPIEPGDNDELPNDVIER